MPEQAWERISDKDCAETAAKKQADTRKGKQFFRQPAKIARKTAKHRDAARRHKAEPAPADIQSMTRSELLEKAAHAGVAGRSRMSRARLLEAIG